MFNKTQQILSVAVVATSLGLAASVQAEAADSKAPVTKLDSFLCKDITRLSGEDRAVALGLLHGYFLGKAGAMEYQSSKVSKGTDDFIEYCLDHPKDQALSSFAKVAK